MLSIKESRKYLGELSNDLNDEQVDNLRKSIYLIVSDILDDQFKEK